MRDIIFRAKAVGTNEWVYGSLVKESVEDWIEYSIIDKEGDTYIIHEETIGEYTGLRDKNQIRVYEGDIIRFLNDLKRVVARETEYIVGEIKWIDGAFWCHYEDEENLTRLVSVMESYWCEEMEQNQIEIIGNIKENAELLEKK